MTAGKQKNTPVIVMKKKRHIISPPPTEEHVITPPPPELPSGTVENEMPAHQAKKNKKWTPEFINTSLEKVQALFPLLRTESGVCQQGIQRVASVCLMPRGRERKRLRTFPQYMKQPCRCRQ